MQPIPLASPAVLPHIHIHLVGSQVPAHHDGLDKQVGTYLAGGSSANAKHERSGLDSFITCYIGFEVFAAQPNLRHALQQHGGGESPPAAQG